VRARLEQDYSDKVEKMQEEMIQMVDDDEIENVGIMSGFMDELEELISEIDAEDLEKNKGGDEADTAKLMGRTPNSPEILMNNLRGDMRSVDARREELADLVGMREAQETPEGVLTLLQSVLAQQEAVPPMPMAPPMPPQGMPPEMMGGMPPEMMGGMPPQGMPPQGMAPPPMGIESVMPDMPGMYRGGPVQNFNRGSGQMGVTPASDAFAAYPSDVVEEAKRRVRHMVDGGMVQKYDRGGVVQHYAQGPGPIGVISIEDAIREQEEYEARQGMGEVVVTDEVVANTAASDRASLQALLDNATRRDASQSSYATYLSNLLGQQGSAIPDLETTVTDEAALYERLGLGTDKSASQAQMLFDIGQAAFGYAGNVGADGRPMQGSAAARLSQSLGPLSGKIGAQAGQMSKEAQALKLAAFKGAQGKLATAQASNEALADRQMEAAIELAKLEGKGSEKENWRTLSEEEATAPAGLHRMSAADFSTGPWQVSDRGQLKRLGKNASLISNPAEQSLLNKEWNEVQLAEYQEAQKAASNIQTIDDTYQRIAKLDEAATGLGANIKQQYARTKQFLGIASDEDINKLTDVQLVNAALGQSVFGAITALGIGARGLDTPAERDFLRDVLAGRITLNKATLLEMTLMRRRQEMKAADHFNKGLDAGHYDYFFNELGDRATKARVEIPTIEGMVSARNKETVADILNAFVRTEPKEDDN
jgi:hypothetical protein